MAQLVDDGSTGYVQANGAQEAIDSGNTTSYPLTDALGSVRGIHDSSGTLTGTTSYDAFGVVRSQSGSSLALGYTSELTDPTTGFIDLRARQLDPTPGRFLSADTVQPNAPGSQGYNLYAYVANNPTTWVDPSGHLVSAAGAAGAFYLPLLLDPELVGLVAIGVFVVVVLWVVVAILRCVLETGCMDRVQHEANAIQQYGSTAAAGSWALGGAATRTAWQNFPQSPKEVMCAMGAAENMAVTSVQNAVGGGRGSASDYSMAAAWGCATSGSGGGGGEGGNGGGSARAVGKMNPYEIRFSQDSISYNFRDGMGTIDQMAEGLRSGSINPDDIPLIRIFKRDGKIYTLDNRRLWAFREANIDIPYRWATDAEIKKEGWKFTTVNDGSSVVVKGRYC